MRNRQMITGKLIWLAAFLGMAAIGLGQAAVGQSPPPPQQETGALPQPSWHTVAGPDSSFTAEMPAAPDYSNRNVRTAAGSVYILHQYLLERGNDAYVIQTAVYPEDVKVTSPRANLQGGLDEAAKVMDGGKWASIDWGTRQGLMTVEAIGARGSNVVRTLSTMKGRQIFSLTFTGPSADVRSSDVDRFLASFRIGP